ncbi:peptide deformylase, partial [Candidatus Saccharibacteria bacterium 32-45-3]
MSATKDNIITLPHPDLRKKSQRVHVITEETRSIIQDMRDAMIDWEDSRPHEIAVALAAVQIDHLERIVIVREDFDDKDNRNYAVLINPEIVKTEGVPTVIQPEGCLSVKDVYGKVKRFPKIRVKALNEDGYEIRIRADGFLSMLLQHEID